MRVARLVSVAVLLAAIAPGAAAQTHPRPPRPHQASAQASEEEDRTALEELHQRDINANIAFDLDQMAGLWDDNIVALPPGSAPLAGVTAYRNYLAKERDKLANVDILSYEEQWDEVRILGDYAYEYGSVHSRRQVQETNHETSLALNVMRILKREASGDWKIYRVIWNDRGAAAAPASASPGPGY